MRDITTTEAQVEAIKIVLRCVIMDSAARRPDNSDDAIRAYVSSLHDFCSSQVKKITSLGTPDEDAKLKIDAQIDRIFSGLGISKV